MNRYILWDLDGTIVESENVDFKFNMFKTATDKLNLTFNLSPDEYIGHEARFVFKRILEKNTVINTKHYYSQYKFWYESAVEFILDHVSSVLPRENVLDIWHSLYDKEYKHAVVTSSRTDVAIAYLKNLGLHEICETIIGVDCVANPKPHPEPYNIAVNKLFTTKNKCLVIEDSNTGISSATQAGLYTIAWVKNKSQFINSPANKLVSELSTFIIENAFSEIIGD